MTFARISYFVLLAGSGILFIFELSFASPSWYAANASLTRSIVALVILFVWYISKVDRPYLIMSMPLRVVMGLTGLLSLGVMVMTITSS